MATKTLNTRVKHKRDTSANWTSNNPVLLDGEIILVDTANGELRFKVGDGTKAYTQLPFTDEPLRTLIPTATSDLTNDSGFITSSDIPVTSVNSKTGAVSLTYTDVGAAAASHGTHVTFDTANNPAMDGTAAKGSATTVARSDHVHPTDTSRAPTSHASSATTYGTGTSANYGHVKLSDSTSSTSSTNGGVAATPAAVKAVADSIPSVPSWAMESTKPTYTASEVGAASSTHSHGNITSAGDITTTATIASGDRIIINDESASKVTNSSITFGTSTTQYLANNGTWQNVPSDSDTTYSLSMSGNRITLTPSSGTATYVDLPIYDGGVT